MDPTRGVKRRLVLVVEDDAILGELLKEALEGDGYGVVVAVTYSEALKIIEGDAPPHYALLDHVLPDGLGADLCRAIKARDPQIPCVVFSGTDAAALAVAAGADRWLYKPFSVAGLVSGLRALASA
jgi:DNA-binding response OmpR family regulator